MDCDLFIYGNDCDFCKDFFEKMLKLLAKGRGLRVKSNCFPIKGMSSSEINLIMKRKVDW
jgi:hypothetical protein